MAELQTIAPILLGQRLAEARKASGKTQEEVALALGCSRPTFIAMEKGTRAPRSEELVKLASLYGRTVHELVRPDVPVVALEPHLRAAVDQTKGEAPDLIEPIRELERFAEDYLELEKILSAPLKNDYPPVMELPARTSLEDFAEDVAVRERARLLLGDQPILDLRRILEADVGLRVFYGVLPSPIAGMYAYAVELGYCVLINRKHPPERRRASLSHEYGHFLIDRHRPGIDYLSGSLRKPANERFSESFAMAFLMPKTGVRKQFADIVNATNDFQVADLCRLSSFFFVSVQAMALRLEGLGLLPKGTWKDLVETGFKPNTAKRELSLSPEYVESDSPYPERYKYLAVSAYERGLISEGQLARFLRCDRVTAREIVEECINRRDIDPDGNESIFTAQFDQSLLSGAQ